jgi:hypothetical protein
MGMRANAHLRKRGPEPKNAAVERREASALIARGAHASQGVEFVRLAALRSPRLFARGNRKRNPGRDAPREGGRMSRKINHENQARRAPLARKPAPHSPSKTGVNALMAREGGRSARNDSPIVSDFDPESETLDDEYAAFHKRAKRMPEPERKATQAKFELAFAKRRVAVRRILNNHFMFWLVCRDKACKRTSRCEGDPEACAKRWWPVTPEVMKVHFRAFATASAAGHSPAEAQRMATAEVERRAEHIARVDAEMAAAEEAARMQRDAARVPQTPAPSPLVEEGDTARGPRVRSL